LKKNNINTYMKKLTLIVIAFCLFQTITAQTNIGQAVRVVKPYKPTVSDAFKLSILPTIKDTIKLQAFFDYLLMPEQHPTGLSLKKIKASEISREPESSLNNSYLKLGGGNYNTPMAELYLNSLRSQRSSIGLKLKHISSYGKIKLDDGKKVYAGYGDNEISLYTKRFMNNYGTFSGDFGMVSNSIYSYGYDPLRTPDSLRFSARDSIPRKVFLLAKADIQIKSNNKDKGYLNYDFLLHYHYMHNSSNNQGHNASFKMDLDKYYSNKLFGINAGVKYFNKANLLDTLNFVIANINPFFGFDLEKFDLVFGANNYYDSKNAKYHFYPRVNATVKIVDVVAVYFGFDGGLISNEFKKVSFENPYVVDNLNVRTSNKRINAFGGVRTSFGSPLSFSFQTSYSEIDDMYFFVNDSLNIDPRQDRFNIVYDDVKFLKVHAEVGLRKLENLSFALQGNYYQYTMLNEAEPWHKPEFDASLEIEYLLKERVLLSADVFLIGKRYAKSDDPANSSVLLDAITDINLGCEYYFTKMFSAFLNINNILGSKYYIWNNYPVQGFNFLGGIKYSF